MYTYQIELANRLWLCAQARERSPCPLPCTVVRAVRVTRYDLDRLCVLATAVLLDHDLHLDAYIVQLRDTGDGG